jgi:hypothetical protein
MIIEHATSPPSPAYTYLGYAITIINKTLHIWDNTIWHNENKREIAHIPVEKLANFVAKLAKR